MIEFDWQIFWMWMDRMEKHKEEELKILKDIQDKITDIWRETCNE